MKVSLIFGTRPEAIKLAPVILELRRREGVQCHVCVTGQHRQMLDQIMEVFGLVADRDLDVMRPNQSLAGLTARATGLIDEYLSVERPDLVLVQGDTTTAFCAALTSFYHRIPIGHVEAGLRTWNLEAPWPEEANRVLTTRLANLHFAPTTSARNNLLREGVDQEKVFVTGNTVIDALKLALVRVREEPPLVAGLPDYLSSGSKASNGDRRLVLITGHRRESFGEGFESICHAIADLACRFPGVDFVYPVHLNPNVREPVMRILGAAKKSRTKGAEFEESGFSSGIHSTILGRNIYLIEPLSYLPFVHLMDRSTIILTDSGGVQEEAPSLGKPVLVMRETTERPEAVEAGSVRLIGTDRTRIIEEVSRLLTDEQAYEQMARAHSPYGDGHSSPRIVDACLQFGAVKLGV